MQPLTVTNGTDENDTSGPPGNDAPEVDDALRTNRKQRRAAAAQARRKRKPRRKRG